MGRALELARRGLWSTDPNPRVGCVIAHGGEVVGEGWHRRAGDPHAEVEALRAAGVRAQGATAYVTLEPCSHHGRTPPCADALVAARIARVVFAVGDPNPHVNGGGAARLADAGIAVQSGLCETPARVLNAGFFSRMTRGRPYVRVKIGASLDGGTALANGLSRWITSPEARADVQRLRAGSSAVASGSGTVLADDPRLDVRIEGATRQPLRVLFDGGLRIPARARVFSPPGQALVLTRTGADPERIAALRARDVRVAEIAATEHGLDLQAALALLAAFEVNELLVEGGPRIAGAFIAARLVDELVLYLSPSLLGGGARTLARLPEIADLESRWRFGFREVRHVGPDLRLTLVPPERGG
jgi:diaminohydroxyphosphoribosylaminopyrimidine deaminase/5-amino-6-(5-phosphoribosylamino)uracil reductase